jgi:hypothetical protein
MPDATGTLQSRGTLKPDDQRVTRATIDGTDYYVPEYVLNFLSRQSDGSTVDFRFEEGKDGRRLTKIQKHKDGDTSTATASPKDERVLHPVTVLAVSQMSISFQFMEGQKNKSSLPMTDSGFKIVTSTLNGRTPPFDAAVSWNQSTGYLSDFKLPGVSMPLEEWDELVKKYQPHPEEFKPATEVKKPQSEPVVTPPPPATVVQKPVSVIPPPNSTITLSAKVNLDHYEMLSVSVSGEAADREALIRYMRDSLQLFGRDEVTRERINAYLKRVWPEVPA